MPEDQTIVISYKTKAEVRGDYELKDVYFRYCTVLGLWEKQIVFPISNRVKVIPNMSQVKGYLLEAQAFLLHEGLKLRKNRVGSGEFTHIRSYVVGDDPRKINWRQSAKQNDVMTNVYEPEHGKYIAILIDCGRAMGIELTESNRLERALEAALTVAAIALQRGDHVSVIAFSTKVKRYVPPGKGMAHLRFIVKQLYDLQADSFEANYVHAFQYLENIQKKRSLALLFSDLDPIFFEETPLVYMQRIRRRHLFLLLGIADPMIAKWVKVSPEDTKLAMTKSAAQRQLLQKEEMKRNWERKGLQLIEAPEEKLATVALSRYIEIMNRDVL
jgi:uncharacterized protein (DUF58 family)